MGIHNLAETCILRDLDVIEEQVGVGISVKGVQTKNP